MTQAVILAGGAGTRLASVSGGLPKPLVPVAGIPVVERQIALLARYGLDEVFLTTGYGADVLQQRLGDGARLGVRLHHVREDEPLGTAGGVAALREVLRDDFLVLYGDVLVNMDLGRLLAAHRQTAADATIVVHPNDHPYDSDLVDLDARGRVRGFYPKPRPEGGPDLPNMVSAALYVLSPRALQYIESAASQDFVRDVFPRLLQDGAALYGYATTEYLKDMGTPERLARVEQDVEAGVVEARHADHQRPTLFLDRDGVINREIDGVLEPGRLELLPGVGEAIRRVNKAGWLVAGVTNQPAIAKGLMSEADLERVHLRLQRVLGDCGAWLDALVHCPHHPDKGFEGERRELKIECSCRKPAAGMLAQVAARIPVERHGAVMVGDSWRDFGAARAFGAEAIAVLSGHPLDSGSAPAAAPQPDVVVQDLAEAVSLLLDPDPSVEALANEVHQRHAASREARVLVLLAGPTASDRANTGFRLRRALRARGEQPLWLRLDAWLAPASSAPEGPPVPPPATLEGAAAAVDALKEGRGADVPAAASPEWASAHYDTSTVSAILVEGARALELHPAGEAVRVWVAGPGEGDASAGTADDEAHSRMGARTPIRLTPRSLRASAQSPGSAAQPEA